MKDGGRTGGGDKKKNKKRKQTRRVGKERQREKRQKDTVASRSSLSKIKCNQLHRTGDGIRSLKIQDGTEKLEPFILRPRFRQERLFI